MFLQCFWGLLMCIFFLTVANHRSSDAMFAMYCSSLICGLSAVNSSWMRPSTSTGRCYLAQTILEVFLTDFLKLSFLGMALWVIWHLSLPSESSWWALSCWSFWSLYSSYFFLVVITFLWLSKPLFCEGEYVKCAHNTVCPCPLGFHYPSNMTMHWKRDSKLPSSAIYLV